MNALPALLLAATVVTTSANAADTSPFVARGDVVVDTRTGLTWQRCSVGQTWSDEHGCTGDVRPMHWRDAVALANGPWRLPRREELRTLVRRDAAGQKATPPVDEAAFPGMDPKALDYWSCTGRADGSRGWSVNFSADPTHAMGFGDGAFFDYAVRLVQGARLSDAQADALAGVPAPTAAPASAANTGGPGC